MSNPACDSLSTDWINSTPVYYNIRTKQFSHTPTTLIDRNDLEFHPEGLANYVAFGYSVFGQSPLNTIRFLAPCERIRRDPSGDLVIEKLEDPADRCESFRLSESDTIDRIAEEIRLWVTALPSDQTVVLPLSGGFDSRLLAQLIPDGTSVQTFTYGVSFSQNDSFEVKRASAVAKLLGLTWQQIELQDYHHRIDQWLSWYGPATHCHGMYHIEFYSKIKHILPSRGHVLSGFLADGWAGGVNAPPVTSVSEIERIAYSHGLNADASQLLSKSGMELRSQYWKEYKSRLADPKYRVIALLRFKSLLLSYLLTVPRLLGYDAWSPFLSPEICLSMLNLPESRRKGRVWQKEYFRKHGLDIETHGRNNRYNDLNRSVLDRSPVPPLSASLLGQLFRREYIEWINRTINTPGWKYLQYRWPMPLPFASRWQRLRRHDDQLKAYCAYLTILPIQRVLEFKNGIRGDFS